MEHLPAYYTALFNTVTDALRAMDRQDFAAARALLVQAQQSAEEGYLRAEDNP